MNSISIKMNSDIDGMIQRLGDDFQGGIKAGTTTVLESARTEITPEVPVVTSNLVNSAEGEVSDDGKNGVLRWLADYGRYLIEGTGLYGPKGQKIVPKNAKALKIPGIGFRKSVKGIKPNDFIGRGVEKMDPQQSFETGMGNYLRKKGW